MQYWQRRLHRSVTETRRLRSGRPKRSKGGIGSLKYDIVCYPSSRTGSSDGSAVRAEFSAPLCQSNEGVNVNGIARSSRIIALMVVLAGASVVAQGRGDQQPQGPPAPPPDEPRVA